MWHLHAHSSLATPMHRHDAQTCQPIQTQVRGVTLEEVPRRWF